MPFLLSEYITNASHRGLALVRMLGNLAPEHFISSGNKTGLKLMPLLDRSGKLRTCHLCGFAMASLELSEEWLMQSCSATGFKAVNAQPKFALWIARLKRAPQAGKTIKNEKQYSDVSP